MLQPFADGRLVAVGADVVGVQRDHQAPRHLVVDDDARAVFARRRRLRWVERVILICHFRNSKDLRGIAAGSRSLRETLRDLSASS